MSERKEPYSEPAREPLERAEVVKRQIAEEIAKRLPKGWTFCLVLTSNDAVTYVTNEDRDPQLGAMLRSLAEAVEQGKPGV